MCTVQCYYTTITTTAGATATAAATAAAITHRRQRRQSHRDGMLSVITSMTLTTGIHSTPIHYCTMKHHTASLSCKQTDANEKSLHSQQNGRSRQEVFQESDYR